MTFIDSSGKQSFTDSFIRTLFSKWNLEIYIRAAETKDSVIDIIGISVICVEHYFFCRVSENGNFAELFDLS